VHPSDAGDAGESQEAVVVIDNFLAARTMSDEVQATIDSYMDEHVTSEALPTIKRFLAIDPEATMSGQERADLERAQEIMRDFEIETNEARAQLAQIRDLERSRLAMRLEKKKKKMQLATVGWRTE